MKSSMTLGDLELAARLLARSGGLTMPDRRVLDRFGREIAPDLDSYAYILLGTGRVTRGACGALIENPEHPANQR